MHLIKKMATNASSPSTVSSPQQPPDAHLGGTSPIPDDLVIDILLRLPVKHLLRCRCVSKPWCSLIDSTTFVNKNLLRNIECNPDSGIVFRASAYGNNFYLADVDSSCDVTAVEINDPLKTFLSGTLFVGTCNGLVCLWKTDYEAANDIYIWNPATRKATQLPKPPEHVPFPIFLVGSAVVGFGYDHSNDDYKVVTSVDSQIWGIMVAVYSLKSNSWKRAETITNKYCITGHFGVHANGSVYWLASKDSYIIFAFDLGVERHKELPFPAGVDPTNEDEVVLTVVNGRLCLLYPYPDSHGDIWLMNNNGVENSWSKLFSVKQAHICKSIKYVWPIAFSKSRNDYLLQVDEDKFMWYDLVRNKLTTVTAHGIPVDFDLLTYTESLVQPTCNIKLDGKQQQKNKMSDYLSDGFKPMM